MSVFRRPREPNLYLDSFLHSINNYKLSITDSEIKEDFRLLYSFAKDPAKTLCHGKGK